MACRSPPFGQEGTSTQTTPVSQAEEAPPFLARGRLSDDLTTGTIDPRATAPTGTDEAKRGTPSRLSGEPGICLPAQRTPGASIGRLAHASEREPGDGTSQLCQWHSS